MEGGGLYYIASEWAVAYGYDSETGERVGGGTAARESRSEPHPQQSSSAAPSRPGPGDDPFAPRPAVQGAATGSAGPVSEATLAVLMAMAKKAPELSFNDISNKLYQRNVRDLTEGQAVAMVRYVEML